MDNGNAPPHRTLDGEPIEMVIFCTRTPDGRAHATLATTWALTDYRDPGTPGTSQHVTGDYMLPAILDVLTGSLWDRDIENGGNDDGLTLAALVRDNGHPPQMYAIQAVMPPTT